MLPSFMIVDDFLINPHEARLAALALPYDRALKRGNYSGVLSDTPLLIPGLDDAVSKFLSTPLRAQPGTTHGHCRITCAGETGRTGVHVDPCFYSGILYLSLPEHCRGGTEFFRHRRTGLDRVPKNSKALLDAGYADLNTLINEVVNADTLFPAKWERTFVAPMRFNRLILFSPWMFHNSGPGFGDKPENARLVHLMFFATG